jgi:glycosyltransferase involved in cell wall biosynthesis
MATPALEDVSRTGDVPDHGRVLLLTTYSQALSSFVAPFARYLEQQGYVVLLGASDEELVGPSTLPDLRAEGFQTVSIPFSNRLLPHHDLRSAWHLWRVLRATPFDIVHTFTAKAGFIGRLVARKARVPIVVHTAFSFPHLDTPSKAWLYRPLELLATSASDHMFCISRLGYQQALELGRAPRHGISNPGLGLDFRRFESLVTREAARHELGLPQRVPLIGTAARLVPHKRIDLFLAICRDVAAAHPDARFLVLGDGPERSRLDQLVQDHGLSDRVQFLPYLSNSADVVKYFRALDVFTLPTEREGFGMVFAEAMAAETPVVGPDMSPVNDIILNQDTGLLVPPGDRRAYADAVNWLVDNDQARARFGARGRARVKACFDEQIAFAKIEETYRRLRHQT